MPLMAGKGWNFSKKECGHLVLIEYINKTTYAIKIPLCLIFLRKSEIKSFKNFLYFCDSQVIVSLFISLPLHNEVNSRLKKLLSCFVNY